MRAYLLLAIVAPLLIFMETSAHARSCAEIANRCIELGGTKAECFESSRMAACKSTGNYVSPRGAVFPATDGAKKK